MLRCAGPSITCHADEYMGAKGNKDLHIQLNINDFPFRPLL